MNLKDIVSISGMSGLHKIIGKTKTGLILETVGTGKRFPTGVQDNVSILDDISMFTEEGDMKLAEVFVKLNEKEKAGEIIPDGKVDVKTQRAFVTATIKLDNERVYDSDVKKLLNWYHLLKNELDFTTLKSAALTETEATDAEAAKAETVVEGEEKPKAKKAATPKAPKNVAPKNIASKSNSKGSGGAKTTYRPKSV